MVSAVLPVILMLILLYPVECRSAAGAVQRQFHRVDPVERGSDGTNR